MEAAIRFSVLTDVHPMIETFPLERAQEAYEKMMAACLCMLRPRFFVQEPFDSVGGMS